MDILTHSDPRGKSQWYMYMDIILYHKKHEDLPVKFPMHHILDPYTFSQMLKVEIYDRLGFKPTFFQGERKSMLSFH